MLEPKINGTKQVLLWFNTILTSVTLGLLGWTGVRLWDKMDENSHAIAVITTEIAVEKVRQDMVMSEIPKLQKTDQDLREKIEQEQDIKNPKK